VFDSLFRNERAWIGSKTNDCRSRDRSTEMLGRQPSWSSRLRINREKRDRKRGAVAVFVPKSITLRNDFCCRTKLALMA
jgi:hypothetical protein